MFNPIKKALCNDSPIVAQSPQRIPFPRPEVYGFGVDPNSWSPVEAARIKVDQETLVLGSVAVGTIIIITLELDLPSPLKIEDDKKSMVCKVEEKEVDEKLRIVGANDDLNGELDLTFVDSSEVEGETDVFVVLSLTPQSALTKNVLARKVIADNAGDAIREFASGFSKKMQKQKTGSSENPLPQRAAA